MSGIVAVVNFDGAPVDPQVLKAMAKQCAYRGPDGIHYWIEGNVGLANLALQATPEALREHQPQVSEDGRLCLTADARVDNRPELIPLLQAQGEAVSKESTDADLILAAYRVWGEACPEQLIGDYAFAIWDAKEQRLFCARDVYGVKSLHYCRVGATLCVASEAQQIIQHPKVPRSLDEVTVADFLTENFNDEGRTMFLGVSAVRRAHYLTADAAGQRMERYWDIDPNKRITYQSDEEYAAHFLEIFERAVADRLRTPGGTIGITMSGGMDSTSIAAVAQQIINSQGGRPSLLACSYAFDTLKECDESYYSRAMRDELGIELVYVPAENYWFLDNDEAYTPSLETPFMTPEESITQNMLGIFAERKARVWLTGHGGDSLLGGSPLYYADRLQQGDWAVFWEIKQFWREQRVPVHFLFQLYREWCLRPLIPEVLRKIKRGLMQPEKKQIPDWLEADFARRTHIAERLADPHMPRYYGERARQANYIMAVQIDPIQRTLAWAERLGARFHLEARHPFLDRRLAEFLMAIPPELLFREGWQKFILRKATRLVLPDIIRTRPDKTEFSSYVGLGLRQKETGKIRTLLAAPLLYKLNLIYLTKLQGSYKQCISTGYTSDIRKSLCFITLELWLGKYYSLLLEDGVDNEQARRVV